MSALSDPTAADRPDATTTCPLCDRGEYGEQDLYVHLQVNHRKSTLSEALVDALDVAPTAAER
ncbi:hypothetical protein ACFQL1_08850 [Halomicroarcula sp. GCM10025709]|uniref:hypothetical protein n=1 Tax=Haloarcula TaxID=2237 RepID=UPI0024C44D47|nr:hypothetical protein [Halomicroarcula sp. YJ-61-S]